MTNSNLLGLNGKKVVITGATGGIGGAITECFLKLGAKCFVTGTSEDKLNLFKQKYQDAEFFNNIHTHKANLSDLSECENLIKTANTQMDGIDVLICNAGITKDGLFVRMSNEDFENVIKVNLTANFVLTREATKIMMRKKSGRIILISSVVGVMGNAGQVNYSSSKGGLISMGKSIALEYASRGVTVNTIAPGFIATEMTHGLDNSKIVSSIPLGRQGDAKEIADAAVFLASDMASYITGHTLHVNGGMYME